jgi:hypothetical protein
MVEHLLLGTGPEKSIKGGDLYAKALVVFPNIVGQGDGKVPSSTFRSALSGLSKDPGCKIVRRAEGHGYYLDNQSDLDDTDTNSVGVHAVDVPQVTQKSIPDIREKDLYQVIEQWLRNEEKYQLVRDVSSAKGNGKWGHPDIVGVNTFGLLGSTHVEVCSVEVKNSEKDWPQYIFEAIAHRRFTHRSYYAMLVHEDQVDKLTSGIQVYCDYYGVGLVLIVKTDDGSYTTTDKEGRAVMLDVRNIHYSRHQAVNPELLSEYLKTIKLLEVSDLMK